MWTPFALFAQRHALSWLFEILPLCLLALQALVALGCSGDVNGRARMAYNPGGWIGTTSPGKLQEMLGKWTIEERENADQFMEKLGYAPWQRALIARARQSYRIEQSGASGEKLKIVTQDLRGKSELELPLSGRGVTARDGDGGVEVSRSAHADHAGVVIEERYAGEREPFSVCRRTLQKDGRMCIDVKKRGARGEPWAKMRAIATRVRS